MIVDSNPDAPVIDLNGENRITHPYGTAYEDAGLGEDSWEPPMPMGLVVGEVNTEKPASMKSCTLR